MTFYPNRAPQIGKQLNIELSRRVGAEFRPALVALVEERRISMLGMLIGLLSGMLMSIQGVFNAEVTKQAGVWVAAGFVQLTAFVICVAAWFVTGKEGSISGIVQVKPWYMLLGGVIGAFITYTVIVAINQLGPAKATMFIVSAQLIVSYIISLFGIFGTTKAGFAWTRLFGIAVMIGGIMLFKWDELFGK